MEQIVQAVYRLRKDAKDAWETENPILGLGEPGVELSETIKEHRVKIGDGVTRWKDLRYLDETVAVLSEELNNRVTTLEGRVSSNLKVYLEGNSSPTARIINGTDLNTLAEVDGKLIFVQSRSDGINETGTVRIGAIEDTFTMVWQNLSGTGLSTTPGVNAWIKTGGIYAGMMDSASKRFIVLNVSPTYATTSAPGIVQLWDDATAAIPGGGYAVPTAELLKERVKYLQDQIIEIAAGELPENLLKKEDIDVVGGVVGLHEGNIIQLLAREQDNGITYIYNVLKLDPLMGLVHYLTDRVEEDEPRSTYGAYGVMMENYQYTPDPSEPELSPIGTLYIEPALFSSTIQDPDQLREYRQHWEQVWNDYYIVYQQWEQERSEALENGEEPPPEPEMPVQDPVPGRYYKVNVENSTVEIDPALVSSFQAVLGIDVIDERLTNLETELSMATKLAIEINNEQ